MYFDVSSAPLQNFHFLPFGLTSTLVNNIEVLNRIGRNYFPITGTFSCFFPRHHSIEEREISNPNSLIDQNLIDKMAKKGQSGGYFRFFFFLFTFILLSTYLYSDVKDGWKASNIRNILEVTGVNKFTDAALDKTKQGLSWVDERIEDNFPGYHKTVADFSEPYVELAKNLGIISYNIGGNIKEILAENYPKVVQSIETYIPGMMEQSQNAVSNIWSASMCYYNRSVDYLKQEVFVGQLSPENMQRVVIEAFNTTQHKATEYYHWLYEKVQTTIK